MLQLAEQVVRDISLVFSYPHQTDCLVQIIDHRVLGDDAFSDAPLVRVVVVVQAVQRLLHPLKNRIWLSVPCFAARRVMTCTLWT